MTIYQNDQPLQTLLVEHQELVSASAGIHPELNMKMYIMHADMINGMMYLYGRMMLTIPDDVQHGELYE